MATATQSKPKIIQAVTLHQPWASLIALGLKHYETRDWKTAHRGMLAIHAGRTKPAMDIHDLVPPSQWGILPDTLPFGAVICVVTLKDCIPTEKLLKVPGFRESDEYRYGNFAPGRYAWQVELVRTFQTPFPEKGQQGLWDWEIPPIGGTPPKPEPDRPMIPPAKQRRQQRMVEVIDASPVEVGELFSWQEVARQRVYDKTCAMCGQPARMLIAYLVVEGDKRVPGWCCDECAWKITVASEQAIKAQTANETAAIN